MTDLMIGKKIIVYAFACMALVGRGASAQDWVAMEPITPRGYLCYRAEAPVLVDGRITDASWDRAPWTEEFADIRGPSWPAPRYRTRAKLLWDDEYLYVAAQLEEPHVWGRITEKNAVIFYDNDFEIFIDPDGDNHNYYEFEVNALNTIWELTLARPYKDGGPATHGTNIDGLRSAIHVDGSLNAPSDTDLYWSVEVAIPWKGLARYSPEGAPPVPGTSWRMNFSRVEWQHQISDGSYVKIPDTSEDNWVWSPQGIVDMHRPERWGYVQFSAAEPGTGTFVPDPMMPARDLLMKVYHAQKDLHNRLGRWAAGLDELGLDHLTEVDEGPRVVDFVATADGFTVGVADRLTSGREFRLYTNQESRIWQR